MCDNHSHLASDCTLLLELLRKRHVLSAGFTKVIGYKPGAAVGYFSENQVKTEEAQVKRRREVASLGLNLNVHIALAKESVRFCISLYKWGFWLLQTERDILVVTVAEDEKRDIKF